MLQSVFLDTNILIYFLESASPFHQDAKALIQRLAGANLRIVTSDLSFGEMLVAPIRDGNSALERAMHDLRNLGAIQFVPFDHEASIHFARIRATKSVKPPDAIQLACCAAAGCGLFITNDERLSRLGIPGVQMVSSLAQSPI